MLRYEPNDKGLVLSVDDASPRALSALKERLEASVGPEGLAMRSALQEVDDTLVQDRQIAVLMGAIGLLGLILGLAGLCGLQILLVSRRRREFGMRLALGAEARQILALVGGECLRMAAWGVPVGILGALAILLAGLPAAMEAARVQPAEALRGE